MSNKTLFVLNLMCAAMNFGLGGFNTVFGVISSGFAVWCWNDWKNEEKLK